MKRERWRTVFFPVVLLIIILLVRLFFLQSDAVAIELEGNYYQKAMIDSQGIYKAQSLGIDDIYTMALSASMLLFGNCEMAGVYLNIFLQVLVIVCIYFAVGFVANAQVSLLIAIVISLISFYSDKVYEISSFNLLMLLYAVGLFILSIICKGASMFVFKKKTAEQENSILSDIQEEQNGVITLDDIIGDAGSSLKKEEDKQKEVLHETDAEIEEAVPAGMKEIILDEDDKKKKVKFIENPLPVPKRHEHKEMEFAVELQDDNDDYDIKDISEMDFFDIE